MKLKLALAGVFALCSLYAESGYMEGRGCILDKGSRVFTGVIFPKSSIVYECGFENYPYGDFSCKTTTDKRKQLVSCKTPYYYLRTTIDVGKEDPAIAFSSSGPFRDYVVGNKESGLHKPINPEAILMEHKEEYIIFKEKAKIKGESWHEIVGTFETGDEASTRGNLYFRIYKDGKRVEFNTKRDQFVSALKISYVKDSPNENFDLVETDAFLKTVLFNENLYIWGGGLKFSKKELQEQYGNRWLKFKLDPISYDFLEEY